MIVKPLVLLVATVRGGNGFAPDLHEFQVESDGAAFVTSFQGLRWDMTPDGGVSGGSVWDGILQEIDVPTGLVMYEWHSLDHVPVGLSDLAAAKSADAILDYFHLNSIQLLAGGDLLISARNTSALYEISPAAEGAVRWELGGKKSSFAMGAGTTFWFQHDARELTPGLITLFDDEAAPARAPSSRAIALRLDTASHTVSLAHVYSPPGALLAVALGNVQTLPSGDVLVSWGTTPYVTEYNPAGALVYEATLPHGDDTYRTYRLPWSATPTTRPAVALRPASGGFTGAVSWNGATDVARWELEGGAAPTHLSAQKALPKRGFEADFTVPSGDRFVAVRAIGAGGKLLGSSPPVEVPSSP